MHAGALLLAPGAGADRNQRTLVAVEESVSPLPVSRMDFPYRKAGRKAPDRAPVLIRAVNDEAAALTARAGVPPEQLVLGGRSMGGRMCSLAVAEGLPAAGLVLLSYPLHPPGKPENLRVEHFPALDVPCLFVTGTRDPFGSPDELTRHAAAIPGEVTHVWLEGARHDARGFDDVVAKTVGDWLGLPAR
ncbi:MAG: alpha/beta hydrolase family protein [Acidimicrobiales bacterium]